MECFKCKREVSVGKEAVKCVECGCYYHVGCCRIRTVAKLNAMSTKTISAWRCDDCIQEPDISSDNNSGRSGVEDPSMMAILKSIKKELTESKETTKSCFDAMESKLGSLDTSLNAVRTSLVQVTETLVSLQAENTILKDKCASLHSSNDELKKTSGQY